MLLHVLVRGIMGIGGPISNTGGSYIGVKIEAADIDGLERDFLRMYASLLDWIIIGCG